MHGRRCPDREECWAAGRKFVVGMQDTSHAAYRGCKPVNHAHREESAACKTCTQSRVHTVHMGASAPHASKYSCQPLPKPSLPSHRASLLSHHTRMQHVQPTQCTATLAQPIPICALLATLPVHRGDPPPAAVLYNKFLRIPSNTSVSDPNSSPPNVNAKHAYTFKCVG